MFGSTTVDSILSEGAHTLSALSLSTDTAIIGTLFVVLLAAAWWLGVARFAAGILSLYIALPLYLNFPYLDRFLSLSLATTPQGTFISYALVFVAFAIVGFLVLRRYAMVGVTYSALPGAVEYLALAAGGTGLLLAIAYRILPLDLIYNFNAGIDRFFVEPGLFFWWLLAPLVIIFFATRR